MHQIDIYLSYKNINFTKNNKIWEPDTVDKKNMHIDLLKLNFKLLKKYFSNIHIITDEESLNHFKDLECQNIYPVLNDIDEEYLENVPALCKLYAYNFAANMNKPFVHLDNDFFILEDLNIQFLNSELIAQSIDAFYSLEILMHSHRVNKYCKNKYYYCSRSDSYYNCGIIGGTNFNFLKEYSRTAIDFVLDKDNKIFWNNPSKITSGLDKSVLAEQIYYTCCVDKFGIKIDLVNNKKYNHKWIHPCGFNKYNIYKNLKKLIQTKIKD